MKIISPLGAFAVLCLIIMPAISQPDLKGCTCMPWDCHVKPAENCCSTSPDSRISLSCTCPDQIAAYSGMEYYNPGYSSFSKSGSRSSSRPGLNDLTISGNAVALSYVFPVALNNLGPPDPDVVEYLPPSAKQIFRVLASDGPLTQKDLIVKTDLPPRTVRYALSRLKGENMLEERFCFQDARQILYSLNGIVSSSGGKSSIPHLLPLEAISRISYTLEASNLEPSD
jgi:DNA-binding transcriptional ArsR family regulator